MIHVFACSINLLKELRAERLCLRAALDYADGALRHIAAIDKLSPEASAIAEDAHAQARRVLEDEE